MATQFKIEHILSAGIAHDFVQNPDEHGKREA